MAEIAVSCALLVAAGLMIRSVVNLRTVDWGFETAGVFTAHVGLFEADYPDDESRRQFFDQLQVRLQAIPGMQHAALTTSLPASGTGGSWFAAEGESYAADRDYPSALWATTTPDFFAAFSVDFLEGRDFTAQDRDGGLSVTIVNESFAQRYFPDQLPLGRRIRLGRSQSELPWMTVVGVVPNLYTASGGPGGLGADEARREMIYTPLAQWPTRFLSIVVKTAGDPMASDCLDPSS